MAGKVGRKKTARTVGNPSDSAGVARAVETKNKGGRKPLVTPEIAQRVALKIASGMSFRGACGSCGLADRTVTEWREKGRRGVEPYATFEAAVAQAEAAWQGSAEQRIHRARDWKAQAWLLERRRPEYRPPARVELTGADGGPVLFEGKPLSAMSEAEIEAAKLREAERTLAAHRGQRGEIETANEVGDE